MLINPKDAFLHLIYEYRCLANAGYAWNISLKNNTKALDKNHRLIPELSTIAQDSLLVHVRTLVDFYTKQNPDPTDITLCHFSNSHHMLTISPALLSYLDGYKHSISVHALHLTVWRDTAYRIANANTIRGSVRGRPNWNTSNVTLLNKLIDALEEISKQPSNWQQPLTTLHIATKQRLASGMDFDWPADLGEKPNVNAYLTRLSL